MKFIREILAGIFIVFAIQVSLGLFSSVASEEHPGCREIGCAVNLPGTIWLENPLDDNPGDVKDLFQSAFLGDQSPCVIRKDEFCPAQNTLLDPLFLDRPPPLITAAS